jgi:hypothetical protein
MMLMVIVEVMMVMSGDVMMVLVDVMWSYSGDVT